MELLIFLPHPEPVRSAYERQLAPRFPQVAFRTVGDLEVARQAVADADIFLTFGSLLDPPFFAQARRLRWVHALGTGTDGITDSKHLPADVIVTSTRGIHGAVMSELGFLLMLALSRQFPRTIRNQDGGRWERWPARLLDGKTVGILGVGLIARDLAPRCKAFGMQVIGISRASDDVPGFDRIVPRDELVSIARELDFLLVLVPLDEHTRGLVGAEVMSALPSSSYLINLARGGIVDEAALCAALDTGGIAGAALDAMEREPLPPESPLWRQKNLIITPHVGGFYDTYPAQAVVQIAANLTRFLAGQPDEMLNVVSRAR